MLKDLIVSGYYFTWVKISKRGGIHPHAGGKTVVFQHVLFIFLVHMNANKI